MKQKVGCVTETERDEIRQLFERRNGLAELVKILTADNTELYERLIADMGATTGRFQDWWNEKAEKYQWDSADDGHWEIDFNTCDIYLVIPD